MADLNGLAKPQFVKTENIYEDVVGPLSQEGLMMLGTSATEELDREWARKDGSVYYRDHLVDFINSTEAFNDLRKLS